MFNDMKKIIPVLFLIMVGLAGCRHQASDNSAGNSSRSGEQVLTIAAAANMEPALTEISKQFQAETGIKTVCSFGATGNLAKQIENGAPFDLFISADVKTVDSLAAKSEIIADSKRIYARGKLVVWWPPDAKVVPEQLADVANPEFRRIALAKPEIAPYGAAAKESLEAAGLWDKVEPRVVYGENVGATYQYAKTGNVELAFIPLSLVKDGEKYLLVDEKLHKPIDQAMCILKNSKQLDAAKKFAAFLTGEKGVAALQRYGYSVPD
jgi:molybdate transport system substrate-binding protein